MKAPKQTPRPIAELRDISVVYGAQAAAVHALKKICLQINRGEVLLLMGPSGSGKSTLLQVLGCIRYATAGNLLINNKAIQGLTEDELSQLRCKRMGFVFQHYNLLPSLRAWENVALALELRGQSGPAIEEKSRKALFRLGLKNRADAYPEQLSGGEKQRVAIARAVVGGPDIVLADEPTAALDAVSGGQVAHLLASIAHDHGRAVVVVTHDPRISGIADRIAFIEDGAIRSIKKNVRSQIRSLRESTPHEQEDANRSNAHGQEDASRIRDGSGHTDDDLDRRSAVAG